MKPSARLTARRLALALALLLTPWLVWQGAVRWTPFPAHRLAPSTAASLTLLDARGQPLWQAAGALGGRESWRPLHEIAPVLIDATLAAEDHRFREHAGVDALGVARALWLNLRARRAAYGASTLTMQLVRLLDGSAPTRGFRGKLAQALSAARLERAVGKGEILEQYLNRAYYGNGAFGAEAAARLYFGKPAAALAPGEAAFLAVLPRGPRRYDPYLHEGRTRQRQRHILDRMVALGWLSPQAREAALAVPLGLRRDRQPRRAPHFVDHVLAQLGPEDTGARVHTTLDTALQARLEIAVARHLDQLGGRQISQAGVVVVRNHDGAVLAMVGSRAYDDHVHDGAVNVTTIRRRPGSTLKPFVYALALERGDSPATLAYDLVLPGESRETYTADVRQHGFARYREALAGSYNLAAVHTLQKVGVPVLVERLQHAGLYTLDRPRYDAMLAIGEAEFTVLEYTGAFAAFGNAGHAVVPRALARIERPRSHGFTVETKPTRTLASVFSPLVAYQIFDVLSDPDARRPMFGQQAPMELPFKVALKTGTTRAYTDNLAFGTTRGYTVGAWAGNFDGTPTAAVMAMQGAAPLVRDAFVALAALHGPPGEPARPPGLTEADVCPLSGKHPGPYCPTRKRELFTAQNRPRPDDRCELHVLACGRQATRFPPEATGWARAHGILPDDPCKPTSNAPVRIVYPEAGARFRLDPFRPRERQRPPVSAFPSGAPVRFTVDGVPFARWVPSPGEHVIEARSGAHVDRVTIAFEP